MYLAIYSVGRLNENNKKVRIRETKKMKQLVELGGRGLCHLRELVGMLRCREVSLQVGV